MEGKGALYRKFTADSFIDLRPLRCVGFYKLGRPCIKDAVRDRSDGKCEIDKRAIGMGFLCPEGGGS